jgi:hypothetical protein
MHVCVCGFVVIQEKAKDPTEDRSSTKNTQKNKSVTVSLGPFFAFLSPRSS